MKKLFLPKQPILFISCGDSDSIDQSQIIKPIDEISGEYLLDRFVASSGTQSMCQSFLSISEDLYRMELNYNEGWNYCSPAYIYDQENIYVEGNEIRRASDGYVIQKFTMKGNELILFSRSADNYLLSSQRFHFIKH